IFAHRFLDSRMRVDSRAGPRGAPTLLLKFDDYVLDLEQREVRRGDARIHLQPQVFDVLAYLIRNRARVVGKDELISAIWGRRIVSDSALATRINAARTAIGD